MRGVFRLRLLDGVADDFDRDGMDLAFNGHRDDARRALSERGHGAEKGEHAEYPQAHLL